MLGISHIGLARKKKFSFWPCIKSFIDRACSEQMYGLQVDYILWVVENLESHEFKNLFFIEFTCWSLRAMENLSHVW